MSEVARIYEPVPEDPTMGPAMRKLSPQQRAFTMAYLETGLKATTAARLSGYGGDGSKPQSARAAGHRLTHDQDILDAIKELAEKKVKTGAYVSMAVLLEIAQDQSHKDRFKAAVEIANRSGMVVAQKHEVEHRHEVSAQEAIAQIKAFAKELGLNEKQVLGAAGYTDAEFEVVKDTNALPPPDPSLTVELAPAMSTAGLEDLL